MYGIIDFPLYLIGVVTIVLIPGPNSLYCLAVATQQGARQAAKVMAAIFLGDSVLILCAVGGAASLLKSNRVLFGILKSAGGLYLAYLGINMLRGAWAARRRTAIEAHAAQAHAAMRANDNVFRHALLLSLSNPKAALFFFIVFYPLCGYALPAPRAQLLYPCRRDANAQYVLPSHPCPSRRQTARQTASPTQPSRAWRSHSRLTLLPVCR